MCKDGFNDTAALAICKLKNSSYTTFYWTSGYKFEMQDYYNINLDDVQCGSAEWESCTFSKEHNCEHREDVFLTCSGIVRVVLEIALSLHLLFDEPLRKELH